MPNNIAATAVHLLNEVQSELFSTEILQQIRTGLEFENEFMGVGVESEWTVPYSEITELGQAYQPIPVFKGGTSFNAETNKLFDGMINYRVTEIELQAFYRKWKSTWHTPNARPDMWEFAIYIWQQMLIPKMQEEMNRASFFGDRITTITSGTATTSLQQYNGLRKKIIAAKARAVDPIVPVTIGLLAVNGSDRYDKVKIFCDGLPEEVRELPGTIYMSYANKRFYTEARRATYNAATVLTQGQAVTVDDYEEKTIKSMRFMTGSDMFIFVPDMYKNRIIYLYRDSEGQFPEGYWESQDKVAKLYMNNWRDYGFEYFKALYVSEWT